MKVINTYKHRADGVTELSITKRDGSVHICLIDTADFEEISQHRWTVAPLGYATRYFKVDGKGITLGMHRQLSNELSEGFVVDHINSNRLDNRRSNIRVVTQSENMQNGRIRKNKAIPVKGLCFVTVGEYRYIRAKVIKDGVPTHQSWSIRDYGEEQAKELATGWIVKTRTKIHGQYARHA